MSNFSLFPSDGSRGEERAGAPALAPAPLAARMRPRTLEEFRGQDHVLGPGKMLRSMIERGNPGSMILWGPPGSGKTTLARLLADGTDATFVALSAVNEGVASVRRVIHEAKTRRAEMGRSTILFCDEIHRFNKAQQDAFLPHVENGTIVLIGATTENPSFEVVRPLLSRAPVVTLQPLSTEDIAEILRSAVADTERGLGSLGLRVDDAALDAMSWAADGDARRGLGILGTAAALVGPGGKVDLSRAQEAVQHRFAVYDKAGEEHYNLISALHKAVRGGDPDAALYWLARIVEGGGDPLFIARRLVRMASEDIGLADPSALGVTVAARDAFHFLGPPEGELALAQATVHLACAPKSNRTYTAWNAARECARRTPAAPVPLHIRNAPTELLKELGYGEGYRYDPDEPGGIAPQRYLPDEVAGQTFYRPGSAGSERSIKGRLERWRAQKDEARRRGSDG